jgi:hypothetical protein
MYKMYIYTIILDSSEASSATLKEGRIRVQNGGEQKIKEDIRT